MHLLNSRFTSMKNVKASAKDVQDDDSTHYHSDSEVQRQKGREPPIDVTSTMSHTSTDIGPGGTMTPTIQDTIERLQRMVSHLLANIETLESRQFSDSERIKR